MAFFFSFLMPLDFNAQRAHASSWYACSVECCKACYSCRHTLGEGEVVVEIVEIFICGEEKCINRQRGDGEGGLLKVCFKTNPALIQIQFKSSPREDSPTEDALHYHPKPRFERPCFTSMLSHKYMSLP